MVGHQPLVEVGGLTRKSNFHWWGWVVVGTLRYWWWVNAGWVVDFFRKRFSNTKIYRIGVDSTDSSVIFNQQKEHEVEVKSF